MQDLRVTGVEGEHLLVEGDDGRRYRIKIDGELQSAVRRRSLTAGERKVSPRDIQAHIRAGMSAREVSELTGAPIDHVERFEGPVLAERRHIIDSAREVPVVTAADAQPSGQTFGIVIDERLEDLSAQEVAWGSWKDEELGWVVQARFIAGEVEHDARWKFDPKKVSLAPANDDAARLSRQEQQEDSLIPRLRAVPDDREKDLTRFDSGAFHTQDLSNGLTSAPAPIPFGRSSDEAMAGAVRRSEPQDGLGQTADLLEALRRRRGERETSPAGAEVERDDQRGLIDIPLDDFEQESSEDAGQQTLAGMEEPAQPTPTERQPRARRGRASMPSWDDIVFGARSEDD